MNLPILVIGLSLAFSASFSLASVSTNELPTIQDLTQSADLVFKGEVIDVSYKSSTPQDGFDGIPHTFVTYQIAEVISGQYSGSNITLRFIGGAKEDGGFMLVNDVPLFDVGDEDVLFVKDNTKSGCPLVDCSSGRIRIINGKLYDEEGYRIVAPTNLSNFAKGKREALPSVDEHDIAGIHLRRDESPEPQSFSESTAKVSVTTPQAASATDALPQVAAITFLNHLKSTTPPANASSVAKSAPKVVPVSANINQKLSIAVGKPVAEQSVQQSTLPTINSIPDVSPVEQYEVKQRIRQTEQNQTDGSEKGIMPVF